MNVIFFGTPSFSAVVLRYLLEQGVNIVAVVTKPDRPQGRSGKPVPTPVKVEAESHSLPVFQPEIVSSLEFSPTLQEFAPDLFVVVAYGEILKEHLLNMPKIGCINLHTSLLPKYRGAAPIQRSIINGEKETGVSIMHMAKKMDAGDLIKTVKVPIAPETTFGELEQTLCQVGAEALLSVIREFEKGVVSSRMQQNHELATFAPKIELEECAIRWDLPAATIHNLVRGVNPHPGAWCFVEIKGEKKRLKILKTIVLEEANGEPGEILSQSKDGLVVACQSHALQLLEVQLEGKKAMPAKELIRGLVIDKFISAFNGT